MTDCQNTQLEHLVGEGFEGSAGRGLFENMTLTEKEIEEAEMRRALIGSWLTNDLPIDYFFT
jgi:hypothetical protein